MEEREEGIFFALEEALSFERGQEIDEMLAISLDPDITLQMYEKYVHIRGIVLLQGEYRKYKIQHDAPSGHRNHDAYIEKVIDKNHLEARFSHRFPLDISVPNERVEDLNDIEITIDAFDYELPDVQTLNIQASLHIHGIKGNERLTGDVEQVAQEGGSAPENMEVPEEKNKLEQQGPPKDTEVEGHPKPSENQEHTKMEEKNEPEATAAEKESIQGETPELKEARKESEVNEEEIMKTDVIGMEEQTIQSSREQAGEMAIQLSETGESEEEPIQDIEFLTELFEANEEETKTTIKIYIIQEEDTIESIAKKYNVPTLELMKNNQLTDGELSEGQLIQIPISQ